MQHARHPPVVEHEPRDVGHPVAIRAELDVPGTRACRQAKAKAKSHSQLTPEQKAQRKAARQAMHTEQAPQGAAQAIPKAHKPHPAKSPVC